MGLLVNTYIFYADVYFVQNFIIKLAILFLTTRVIRHVSAKSPAQISIIAILGTISEIIILLIAANYMVFGIFVYLFEIPVIVKTLVGESNKQWIKGCLVCVGFTIGINGVVEILWNNFGKEAHFVSLLVISCLIVILGTLYFLRQKKIQKGIFEVELEHNGTKQCFRAYYDSGNCLKDPYTGKGVHIASEQVLSKLVQVEEKKVCIPYQSLGNETGLLDVYYIEKLQVHNEKEIIELQKIPLGVTKEDLFQGKQYEMILNEEIW